jgi:hypothetical protein
MKIIVLLAILIFLSRAVGDENKEKISVNLTLLDREGLFLLPVIKAEGYRFSQKLTKQGLILELQDGKICDFKVGDSGREKFVTVVTGFPITYIFNLEMSAWQISRVEVDGKETKYFVRKNSD